VTAKIMWLVLLAVTVIQFTFCNTGGLAWAEEKAAPEEPIYVVTHVDVMPKFTKAGRDLLKQFAVESRRDSGAVRLEVYEDVSRHNHSTVVEVWSSRKAYEDHLIAAHTRAYRAKLQPMLGSPFDERLHHLTSPDVGPSSVGHATQAVEADHARLGESPDVRQDENQRPKAQMAQLETALHQADDLKAENARLKSRVALLEAAAQKAQNERAAVVGEEARANRLSNNPNVKEWHLEDAVIEVKVLQVKPSPLGIHLTIHVTNRSKFLFTLWEVGASVYDRAGKFLGTGTTAASNLRQNDAVDQEMLLEGVNAEAVSRWVLQLRQINIENDSGKKLYDADKFFTLKEVKQP
jgi:quinol monooxygenase YgiN